MIRHVNWQKTKKDKKNWQKLDLQSWQFSTDWKTEKYKDKKEKQREIWTEASGTT